jgi:phosphatidylinositol glycan class B
MMFFIKKRYILISKRLYIIILLFSTILNLIVAINSSGYHQEDEHYQVIGFAEYKLGHTNEVSWEYKARIRSTIQPWLCIGVFTVLRSLHIDDPFYLALYLRLLTGVASIIIIAFFVSTCLPDLKEKYWGYFLTSSYFLWFLPYINVRFSSESWSGLFCLLSIAIVRYTWSRRTIFQCILIGLVIGLSILFRFQALSFAFGLLIWCYSVSKIKGKQFLLIITSIFLTLCIGVVIDSLFYQKLTFSLYNYVEINVLKDVASFFGRLPWYYILLYIVKAPIYPIGVLILSSIVVLTYRNPKSIYVWCIIPFLFIHFLTPHKELRFLFPIANLSPIVIFSAIQHSEILILRLNQYILSLMICFLLLVNTIGLIITSTKSTRKGEIEIAGYIYHRFADQKVNLITSYESDPFDPYMGFKHHFYKGKNTEVSEITSIWDLGLKNKIKKGYVNLLVISKSEYTVELLHLTGQIVKGKT